jgi:hypothetical protein
MQLLVAARSGRQEHGVQQGQVGKAPHLNRPPDCDSVHVGRGCDNAVELGDHGQTVWAKIRIERAGRARGAEHSPTAVQFNQPASCAVIGCETLIGGEHSTARRAGETVWMRIWSRIAEVTEQARVHWVAEVKDKRVPRLERVGEELARGHLVFDVVRAAPARRR